MSKLLNSNISEMRSIMSSINVSSKRSAVVTNATTISESRLPAMVIPPVIDEDNANEFRGNLEPAKRHDFIFAGNALFTIKSPSGVRFTYRVTKSKPVAGDSRPAVYFVSVLRGSDNVGDYTYIGCIFATGFRTMKGSKLDMQAPSVKAFGWFSTHMTDTRIEVWHEGHCGRCGRTLTVPESIESGIGPVCEEKGGAYPTTKATQEVL